MKTDDRSLPLPFAMEPRVVSEWITAAELSELAEIDERRVRIAFAKCANGGTWRNHALKVRTANGGPASAQNPYLVHVDSLPPALAVRYMEQALKGYTPPEIKLGPVAEMPTQIDPDAAKKLTELEWKVKVLAPAMEYYDGSPGRAQMLREIAARPHTGLDGKPKRVALRTLQGWITRIKREQSVYGLLRKTRLEKPERQLICRTWDKACPLDVESKQAIAREIATYARSLWAGGVPGWRVCEEYTSSKLMELSRAAGWKDATYELCRVGRHYVEKHSETRIIAVKEKDSKRWFDKFVPRAKRSRKDYRPGDIVVGDVHPVDVLVTREDGTQATHRLIAWLDIATGDLFCTLVLLAAGKGITQADAAASFAAMVEAWGLPRLLMLDNGPEYSWADLERGFKELSMLSRAWRQSLAVFTREDDDAVPFMDDAVDEIDERETPILRALPHRPCSKPIEGIFAVLEQTVMSQFPGWIGGDRMNKRTHQMGKAPNPFPGSPAQFEQAFAVALSYWRTRGRKSLRGKSIDQLRLDFQSDGGPLPLTVPRGALVFALSEVMTRKVGSWGVEVGGQWYRSAETVKRVGKEVTVRYAKWAPEYVFMLDEAGKPHRVDLLPVDNFADGAGSRRQAIANGVLNAHVRELKATTRKVDMLSEMSRHVAQVGLNVPVLKGPAIELSPELQAADESAALPQPENEPQALGYGEVLDRKTGTVVSTIPDHYSKRIQAQQEEYEDDETDWDALGARFGRESGLDEAGTPSSPDEANRNTGTNR